jgi:hypothetical protein
MNKEIYLVQGDDAESYADFKKRISTTVAHLTSTLQPDAIKFTFTEKAPPVFSIIPFSKKKIAAISIYKMNPEPVESLKKTKGFRGAYQAEEAFPVRYEKNWNDGERTPGACLLTLFCKRKKIDYATFIDRWHNGHARLSLRIHPLWNYVRNEVKATLTEDSVPFNGIVEEQMRTEADLLNPFKFFGNPLNIIPRMITEYVDTKSFIDYPSMETYLAAEYLIKTRSSA